MNRSKEIMSWIEITEREGIVFPMSGYKKKSPLRLTQHKRFANAHSNFCFSKTSFMLGTLYATLLKSQIGFVWGRSL